MYALYATSQPIRIQLDDMLRNIFMTLIQIYEIRISQSFLVDFSIRETDGDFI